MLFEVGVHYSLAHICFSAGTERFKDTSSWIQSTVSSVDIIPVGIFFLAATLLLAEALLLLLSASSGARMLALCSSEAGKSWVRPQTRTSGSYFSLPVRDPAADSAVWPAVALLAPYKRPPRLAASKLADRFDASSRGVSSVRGGGVRSLLRAFRT
ncbi:hypothetical protein GGTG_07301 [Gaeumannomyces tritici R3-111a-1]|uniref:Uncharacterized protein n=1 Tax=Gaeumannomyces tritici (strain R3-111a-1) TaxID=644352 RepID=J3P1A4_GAET3|nr:hypothetical protein GGTG_07301 [Gaeumannomyces tritici R3-111a-1]EJT77389.1 hypothetical protein GGTG_07301 [Gaeumannomyces tritici R3-111a-1]